ncbi:serine hydrolase [Halorhodospira neutriphila]|uniref:Beta-lactamase-related domain-containing protein n=1 Tax=Halorhodospira neutriphila TaxID=168379 RepID=A0ABS1E6D6_9GAMM|nr:serine hydrolase [Halorhodospira neutriphila]MBK1725859.1 hypothetical protein [Halorhodospira neutriphila]
MWRLNHTIQVQDPRPRASSSGAEERLLRTTTAEETVASAIDYAEQQDSYAFLVYHQGKLVVERYSAGHGPESRFDSSSMHKSVLGLLLGAAIEDGHIDSLDDPIGDYLPAWSDLPVVR